MSDLKCGGVCVFEENAVDGDRLPDEPQCHPFVGSLERPFPLELDARDQKVDARSYYVMSLEGDPTGVACEEHLHVLLANVVAVELDAQLSGLRHAEVELWRVTDVSTVNRDFAATEDYATSGLEILDLHDTTPS
ncbi:MAG: hypothetical protein PBV01_10450 [Brucella anthropi]